MKIFAAVCVVVAFASSAFAVKCPTCSGSACNAPIIEEKECSLVHPITANVKKDSYYACLELEYAKGDIATEKLYHCVVATPEQELCKTLGQIYNVKSCNVKVPKEFNNLFGVNDESSSTDGSSTDGSSTDGSTTTDITPTTDNNTADQIKFSVTTLFVIMTSLFALM